MKVPKKIAITLESIGKEIEYISVEWLKEWIEENQEITSGRWNVRIDVKELLKAIKEEEK